MMRSILSSGRAGLAAAAFAILALSGMTPFGIVPAEAQEAAPAEERQPEYSKGFRKLAPKVQESVQAKDWPAVLEGVARLEAIEDKTDDDRRVILSWKLSATQATGDREAFIKVVQEFLDSGYAAPEQVGALHQQLAAWYSGQKDQEKTVYHYRMFVESTPDATTDEYETLARLLLQSGDNAGALQWLDKAIAKATEAGETPKELWYQLRDRIYIDLEKQDLRLANLEELVKRYPKAEYYSRVLALYSQMSDDERAVMLNAFRLVLADTGLETVGQYLTYADHALVLGSPGEAERALTRGMADGIVPSEGSNKQTLQEAKAAVGLDRKNLPKDAQTAAANPKGEIDVKVGLGFYSLGEWDKAVEAVNRGLGKGGVKRVDDANLLLGAALVELGKYEEARQAFAAAAAAAPAGSVMQRIAALWSAFADRKAGGTGAA